MWRLFSSLWQEQPLKLIDGTHTPPRSVGANTPHAPSRDWPAQNGEGRTECHESNAKTVREERYLIIDESSGKASVSLRREETVSRSLCTVGGSTFQWRKATPAQAAAALHAQQLLSDKPTPYRNFRGNILAEQTIAPGALPQLQSLLANQRQSAGQPQTLPLAQEPQRLPLEPLLQPQATSSAYLEEDDEEMDLELSALAEDERLRTLEDDCESISSDGEETMELDEPDRSRFHVSDRKVRLGDVDRDKAVVFQHYKALALKLKHPYVVNPPRNRAACAWQRHVNLAAC